MDPLSAQVCFGTEVFRGFNFSTRAKPEPGTSNRESGGQAVRKRMSVWNGKMEKPLERNGKGWRNPWALGDIRITGRGAKEE